jgi:formylglycine-generating enzyme required for sulfatase activity
MEARWFLTTLICLLGLLVCAGAQEMILIPSGEVDGIRIEAFYLSPEVTNQDYLFGFIMRNGYLKRHLWDYDTLQNMGKFKDNQGNYAPRTWSAGNPPQGTEDQPVLGISLAEARAYAMHTGWILPTEAMWNLAKQVKSDLSDYPWKGESDNSRPARLVRYYVPVRIWVDKIKEIEQQQKKLASLSSLNPLTSGIRNLENNVDQMGKDVKAVQGTVQALDKRVPTSELTQKWDKAASYMETMEKSLQANADVQKGYESKLQTLEAALQKWESRGDLLASMDKKLEKLQAQLDETTEKYKALETQVAANKEANASLAKQQDKLSREQLGALESNVKAIDTRLTQLATLDTRFQEMGDKVRKLEALTPPLAEGGSYFQLIQSNRDQYGKQIQTIRDEVKEKQLANDQNFSKFREQNFEFVRSINDIKNTSEELRSNISSLKQADTNTNGELQNLRKQDEVLTKETVSLRESLANSGKRDEKQEKDIAELYKQSAKIQGTAEDLNSKFKESREVDNAQSKRSEVLETEIKTAKDSIEKLSSQNKKLDGDSRSLQDNILKNRKDSLDFEMEIKAKLEKLDKRDDEQSKAVNTAEDKFGGKLTELEKKLEQTAKERDKESRQDMGKLSDRTTHLEGELAKLDKQFSSQDLNVSNTVETLKGRVKNLEEKTYQIDTDLRIGASQLRTNMVEIGERMRQLFQQGMTIGAVPGKDEPLPIKPNDGKTESKPVKGEVDKKILAQLCYQLGEKSYLYNEPYVALASMEVALQFDPEHMESKKCAALYGQEIKKLETLKAKEEQPKPQVGVIVDSGKTCEQMSELCYLLGKEYYRRQDQLLAYSCFELALRIQPQHAGSKEFLQKNWQDLNRPQEMVYVPAGKAVLGNPHDPEFPAKEKQMQGFYMDRHELTRKEFFRFVKSGGYEEQNLPLWWSKEGKEWLAEARKGPRRLPWLARKLSGEEENLPVNDVTYYEAEAYAKWAGKQLPTVEQWEYAARSSDGRRYPWGDEAPYNEKKHSFKANYRPSSQLTTREIARVDEFPGDVSWFGIVGMAGNVAEWCQQEKIGDANKDPKEEFAPIKGGSYAELWLRMQAFSASQRKPVKWFADVGFRCLKEVPENPYK